MITAEGLTKYYGDKCAIKDLSFEIAGGEIVGILGLNGAGKSTTLRVLACLLLPSSGKVTINGLDVSQSPHEIRKLVGFLPEIPPLYGEMTVEAFLCFAGELRGLERRHSRARVQEVLEITQTKDVRDEIIQNLSHGYRQRVGIGQAIVHQPPVLILDEPTSGLDPVQIVEMREMIRGLKGRHTILLSSHILPEISQTCDRLLVIESGQIRASGTEEELAAGLEKELRLRLVVRGEQDKVLALLQAHEEINDCQVTGEQGELLHLRLQLSTDLRETLSRELVENEIGLLQLSSESELESIFLKLTQKTEVTQ